MGPIENRAMVERLDPVCLMGQMLPSLKSIALLDERRPDAWKVFVGLCDSSAPILGSSVRESVSIELGLSLLHFRHEKRFGERPKRGTSQKHGVSCDVPKPDHMPGSRIGAGTFIPQTSKGGTSQKHGAGIFIPCYRGGGDITKAWVFVLSQSQTTCLGSRIGAGTFIPQKHRKGDITKAWGLLCCPKTRPHAWFAHRRSGLSSLQTIERGDITKAWGLLCCPMTRLSCLALRIGAGTVVPQTSRGGHDKSMGSLVTRPVTGQHVRPALRAWCCGSKYGLLGCSLLQSALMVKGCGRSSHKFCNVLYLCEFCPPL